MVDLKAIYAALAKNGIKFFTGVPDSLLNDFCTFIDENTTNENHVIAANEGNAVSIATGYYLSTGNIPLVYMQNSGIGNSINPLISLTHSDVYQIPMILIIGWRGDPEVKDWPQHKKQGAATLPLLKELDIPYKILSEDTDLVSQSIKWAKELAIDKQSVVALVVKKNVFSKKEKEISLLDSSNELTRYEAIRTIIDILPKDAIYVASTGRITRELYYIREEKHQSHENDFLNVGSMGHTLSLALGIALAKKDRLVVCLDGDAAAIMHMGSLAIAASKNPNNLIHVVLNNGVHESVGGQRSIANSINFTTLVKSIGYSTLKTPVINNRDLRESLKIYKDVQGIKFLEVKIIQGMAKKLPSLDFNHIESKNEFMCNLINENKEKK